MAGLAARLTGLVAAGAVALTGGPAWAWGATGHRLISQVAMAALPDELPAFLRTRETMAEVVELGREPDRWRDSGRVHDSDRDGAHFLDLGVDGRVAGGPQLSALPPTRAAYAAALRTLDTDDIAEGYLPYAIVDAYQQLAKDFAYWRALKAAEARQADPAKRAWLQADRIRREALVVRDLAVLSHYVGDASQPLHVTASHDGWKGPNPQGFTTWRIHAPIEGAFVRANLTVLMVGFRLSPYRDCACPIEARTAAYLAATAAQVEPLYALEKAGGFRGADPRGIDFTATRLAAGASELLDMVRDAWRLSGTMTVGYPVVRVAAIEAGEVDPYDSLYGLD
jgi:hypothetical protein